MAVIPSLKKYFYIIFILLVSFSFSAGMLLTANEHDVSAQGAFDPGDAGGTPDETTDEADLEQCAEDLTEYMNTALENMSDNPKIKKLSIAFNMTSPFEHQVFDFMVEAGADFDKLDYWSGNTYTVGGITATEYMDLYGWNSKYSGKPLIITETGDFATKDLSLENRSTLEPVMSGEYKLMSGKAEGVLYFAALPAEVMGGGNEEFEFHNLPESTLTGIVSSRPGGSGVNPGTLLGGSTDLPDWLDSNSMPWILAIITGNDAEGTAKWINSLPDQMRPVIRLCYGADCGFKNPLVLAKFANDLNNLVDKTTYLIIGPNEPLTDPWVSEACGIIDEREWEWEPLLCGETTDPEFHSLRPYPGNFCDPSSENWVEKVLMCGNNIYAAEGFKIDFVPEKVSDTSDQGWGCTATEEPVELRYEDARDNKYDYTAFNTVWECEDVPISSKAQLIIDLEDSEFPVLGNTEDVPNGQSGTNSLSYANRMNNFVSWYLQGAVQTAEEEFASPSDPLGIRNMLDYSGPLQKLYPIGGDSIDGPTGMLAQRYGQGEENLNLGDSHDQIVVCNAGGYPEACYIDDSQTRRRKSEVRLRPLNRDFSYIPLSTTEDELGGIGVLEMQNAPQPTEGEGNDLALLANDDPNKRYLDAFAYPWRYPDDLDLGWNNNDRLFFAHARESLQLADAMQRTYAPMEALDKVDLVTLRGRNTGRNTADRVVRTEEQNDWLANDDNMPSVGQIEYKYDGQYCEVVDAYEGPGDNLYGWLDDEDYEDRLNEMFQEAELAKNISSTVAYEGTVECTFERVVDESFFDECMATRTESSCVDQFECQFLGGTSGDICLDGFGSELNTCTIEVSSPNLFNPGACVKYQQIPVCSVTAMAGGRVELDIPWVESIFNRTVNGGMSIYRRLFPRLASNNRSLPQEQQIIVPDPYGFDNIPAKTTARYGATNLTYEDQDIVTNTGSSAIAGNPLDNKGSEADIYFPYLGSIHEYFLRGVQCALLPAGLGCENIDHDIIDEPADELCRVVWIDESKARNWAQVIRNNLPGQRFASSSFAGWTAYYEGKLRYGPDGDTARDNAKYQHIFESCGGTTPCYNYLINQTLSRTCSGGQCLNPLLVMAIAFNENGGLISFEPGATDNSHFGCGESIDGIPDTIPGKLDCLINTFNSGVENGEDDNEVLLRYGYRGASTAHNINKIMDIISGGRFEPVCEEISEDTPPEIPTGGTGPS